MPDGDDDGFPDPFDNCPSVANPDQKDLDQDGFGDACDNCRDSPNPNQADGDHDSVGDACDDCPGLFNPGQEDTDRDGIGDACEKPLAAIAAPDTIECSIPGGAEVVLDGSGSAAQGRATLVQLTWILNAGQPGERVLGSGAVVPAMLPLGDNPITLRITDSRGGTSTAEKLITVRDSTPPSLTLMADQTVLWPPNHRMVAIHVAWQSSDVCDPQATPRLFAVTSSEPDDAPGDGDGRTTGDIASADVGTADAEVQLRAERSGEGPGRTYEITYAAADASGNARSAMAVVRVPHDLGEGPEPVLIRLEPNNSADRVHLYWNPVSGAQIYDVIRGDLGQVAQSNGQIRLGTVRVLATGLTDASYDESPEAEIPTAGSIFFYLVQYREGSSASGWGTESSSWPAVPSACDLGCPGEPVVSYAAAKTVFRK